MPKVSSLFKLTGNAGGLCFFEVNDQQFVRKPTSLQGDRWWRHRNLHRARERAIEFGGASQAAHHIRTQMPASIRKLAHRYSHNQLAMAIRVACTAAREQQPGAYPTSEPGHPTRYLSAFTAEGIGQAITGLHLGNAQGGQKPQVSVHSLLGEGRGGVLLGEGQGGGIHGEGSEEATVSRHYTIHGLRAWAETALAPPEPGVKREFRIHIAFATAADMVRDPHAFKRSSSYNTRRHRDRDLAKGAAHGQPATAQGRAQIPALRSSQWATVHAIDPNTDILDLPCIEITLPDTTEGSELLVFIAIEWQDRTGKRYKRLHSMSTFQGVEAIHLEAGAAPAPSPRIKHKPRKSRLLRSQRTTLTHRQPVRPKPATQAQRLVNALSVLAAPG